MQFAYRPKSYDAMSVLAHDLPTIRNDVVDTASALGCVAGVLDNWQEHHRRLVVDVDEVVSRGSRAFRTAVRRSDT